MIGQILARAPIDPDDGAWPHRTVRDAIDDRASEDLDRGVHELAVLAQSSKGSFTKLLFEGGDQERKLAEQYENFKCGGPY